MIRQLQNGGHEPQWTRVETADAMKTALDRQQRDVILCDYKMPRFSAPAVLKILQETKIDVPFIIVSGAIGEDTAVAAMKSGAHDFLMKDKHRQTRSHNRERNPRSQNETREENSG